MSTQSVEILTSADYSRWDSFVASSPQGSIFQSSEWIKIFCAQFGYTSEILSVVNGQEIIGGVVLFQRQRLGVRAIMTPPMMPYNGILFAPPGSRKGQRESKDNHEITSALLPVLEEKGHFVSLMLSPSVIDIRPFQWRKWTVTSRYTYANSLKNPGEILEMFSHSARRRVRKASEENITFEEIHDSLPVILLQEESYLRSGIKPPVRNELLQELCTRLIPSNALRFFGARHPDGTLLSAQAVITSGTSAYLWFFGRRSLANQENGSSFLMWKIFSTLAGGGISAIDLIGANTPSIAEFKSSFGGILTNYYDVQCYHPKSMKILMEANNIIHRLRRRK
jgi:hypothetical protein